MAETAASSASVVVVAASTEGVVEQQNGDLQGAKDMLKSEQQAILKECDAGSASRCHGIENCLVALVNGTRENGTDMTAEQPGVVKLETNGVQEVGVLDTSSMILPTTQVHKTQHMVQNQMTPSYPQFPQTSIEDYQQAATAATVATTAAVTDPTAQQPYKDGQAYVQAPVTQNGVEQQTKAEQTDLESEAPATSPGSTGSSSGPKRLHVSNIPFRFREADLRSLLGTQFGPILDVEIIFNERGSKGFGFVTFANSADADRAREKLNGTVVEGRKIEVNNATARVMTKKSTTTPGAIPTATSTLYENTHLAHTAALRGVAFTRGRARGAYTAAAAAAAAAFRHPAPLATAATGLPYTAGVYQDPFLATYAERYQPYAAGYAAAATRYAIPTVATAATYAATGYGREYAADPYIGHSIGPVTGYGVSMPTFTYSTSSAAATKQLESQSCPLTYLMGQPNTSEAAVYRGGYQRFAPY